MRLQEAQDQLDQIRTEYYYLITDQYWDALGGSCDAAARITRDLMDNGAASDDIVAALCWKWRKLRSIEPELARRSGGSFVITHGGWYRVLLGACTYLRLGLPAEAIP